jgi:hypothetical protein
MARTWIIPAGAGVLSALLFLAVAVGSPGALILGYLAPLPLFAMGLGAGLISAATAGATAAALVGAIAGLIPAVTFAALLVAPAVVLVRQSLLSRIDANGRLEWYPPGRLVLWLVGGGACLFVAATVFVSGGRSIEERLRGLFSSALSAYVGPTPATQLQPLVELLSAYPSIIAVSWLAMIAVNGILAQGLLVRFGRNLRPSPPIGALELPRAVGAVTALAAALAVLAGGSLEFIGRNLLVMLGLAFFFAGLGVVHGLLQQVGQRLFVLIGLYVFVLVFGWPIPLVAVVGFVDHWAHFRRRLGRVSSGGS